MPASTPTRLLLLACFLLPCAASDSDLREELRDCYKAAAEERDIWTMLQLEAWCDANDVRQRNRVFGKARIIGSPLFGVPDGISYEHDRGDVLLVVSHRRLYQWAPDGRPLCPSMPIPNGCNIRAASNDGRYVFIGDYDRDIDEKTYHVRSCIVDAQERRILRRHEFDLPGNHSHDYTAAIADDGSAALIGFMAESDDPASRDSLYLLRSDKKEAIIIHDLRNPRAVGPKGAWMVARESQHPGRWLLVIDEKRIALRHFIDGPDNLLAFIDEQGDSVQVIDSRSRIRSLKLPFPLNDHSDLIEAGPWLAIDGRGESKQEESTDIFGETTVEEVGGEHAFYAWSELADAAKAKPRVIGNGILAGDFHRPDAVLSWEDGQIRRLQVDPESENGLRSESLITLDDARINWVSSDDWHYNISLENTGEDADEDAKGKKKKRRDRRESAILNLNNEIIWRGPRRNLYCLGNDRSLAVTNWRKDSVFELLKLAVDEKERQALPLAMETGRKQQRFDVFGRRAYIYDDIWYEIDLRSGTLLGAYDPSKHKGFHPEYIMPWGSDHPHRHLFADARLYSKQLPSGIDWAAHPALLQYNDALQVPGGIAVLARSGHVLLFNKRDAEPSVLGLLNESDGQLMQAKGLDLALIDRPRQQLLGSIEQGKKLRLLEGDGRPLGEMPKQNEGSWKVDGMRFDLGRYGQGEWPEAAGFRPLRLRSHSEAASLLIVTRSCIIEIEQRDMARFMSMFSD